MASATAPAQQGERAETSEASEEEASESSVPDVRRAFEIVPTESFDEQFPEGKASVVDKEVGVSAAVLTTAHRLALERQRQRYEYRRAAVYQAAARSALEDDKYAVAMYLTLHARALGREVIRANTARSPGDKEPLDLELVRSAGGVDPAEVVDYLADAEKKVPAVRLLFAQEQR